MHHKLDLLGIGAQHTEDPDGIAWRQNRDFENLLKRLNSSTDDPVEDGVNPPFIDGFRSASVIEPSTDTTDFEARAGEQDNNGEIGERKRKKRPRDNRGTTKMEGKSKKRKQAQSTAATLGCDPVENVPSTSKSSTPESIPSVAIHRSYTSSAILTPGSRSSDKLHLRRRAHRARFVASKRLAATPSTAIAEILGMSTACVTPPPSSGLVTPDITSQVEDDQYGHLTVSTRNITDYFRDKMRHVVSKPGSFGVATDGISRGGIGYPQKICSHDGVGESGTQHGGLGTGIFSKTSTAAEKFAQGEIRKRNDAKNAKVGGKYRSEGEGEVGHKPKNEGKGHTSGRYRIKG